MNIRHTAAAAAALLAAGVLPLSAQVRDVSTMMTSWTTTIKGIVDPTMNLVSIILGIIGFIKLIPIFSKYLKGEPTSADAFLNHGGGFVMAFIAMQLIRLAIQ